MSDEYLCDDTMYSESGLLHTLWSLPVEEREKYFKKLKEEKQSEKNK